MTNPYLTRTKKSEKQSPAYWRSRKQEKRVAKKVKGSLVPRSGAGHRKGDVQVRNVLRVECKTTDSKSFRLSLRDLDKVSDQALASGEIAAMVIEFCDPSHLTAPREFAVIRSQDLYALLAAAIYCKK